MAGRLLPSDFSTKTLDAEGRKISEAGSAITDCASSLSEYPQVGEKYRATLEGYTKRLIDAGVLVQGYSNKVRHWQNTYAQDGEPVTYMESTKAFISETRKATNYADHELYRNLSNFLKSENEEDDDVDLQVVEDKNQIRSCPITLQPFEHPMKNSQCGHTYEKSAILSSNFLNKKCPVAGCNNKCVRKNDLVEDREMAANIARVKRAAAGSGTDDEEEEENNDETFVE